MRRPELAAHLAILRKQMSVTLPEIGSKLILDPLEVTALREAAQAEGILLSTDGNRFLEYSTPRHNLEPIDHTRRNLEFLLGFVKDPTVRQARALAQGL